MKKINKRIISSCTDKDSAIKSMNLSINLNIKTQDLARVENNNNKKAKMFHQSLHHRRWMKKTKISS